MPEEATPEPLDISLRLADFEPLTEREEKIATAASNQAAVQAWTAFLRKYDELGPLRQQLRELVQAHPAGVWKATP